VTSTSENAASRDLTRRRRRRGLDREQSGTPAHSGVAGRPRGAGRRTVGIVHVTARRRSRRGRCGGRRAHNAVGGGAGVGGDVLLFPVVVPVTVAAVVTGDGELAGVWRGPVSAPSARST